MSNQVKKGRRLQGSVAVALAALVLAAPALGGPAPTSAARPDQLPRQRGPRLRRHRLQQLRQLPRGRCRDQRRDRAGRRGLGGKDGVEQPGHRRIRRNAPDLAHDREQPRRGSRTWTSTASARNQARRDEGLRWRSGGSSWARRARRRPPARTATGLSARHHLGRPDRDRDRSLSTAMTRDAKPDDGWKASAINNAGMARRGSGRRRSAARRAPGVLAYIQARGDPGIRTALRRPIRLCPAGAAVTGGGASDHRPGRHGPLVGDLPARQRRHGLDRRGRLDRGADEPDRMPASGRRRTNLQDLRARRD